MELGIILRQKCLDQIKTFQDKDLIKVVTGVRQSVKSTLLDMMQADLRAIRDAYPKMVVAMRGSYPTEVDGIQIVNGVDFLLHR